MILKPAAHRMARLLAELRDERRISRRQLADQAGVNVSVVSRAERGMNAKIATWDSLFKALGYHLLIDAIELCEEAADLLSEEAELRQERRLWGLCTGKRRWL
ncbi:MAG: helix-turn-helix transcriptional regulator [Elusimicrobia bacterium]|nr:helix-turn-helix transcriptional regulator [Elusimicrobiota bacterium]